MMRDRWQRRWDEPSPPKGVWLVRLCSLLVGLLVGVSLTYVVADVAHSATTRPACFALAHRSGPTASVDENTEAAAVRSASLGAWLDTDLRMSNDSVGFMMHDRDVARTTDGSGRIEDHAATWVEQLRTAKSGARVPTWQEYLTAAGDTPIVVELKKDVADWTDAQIHEVVQQAGDQRVYFGGTPSITKRLADLEPGALVYWRPDVGDSITPQEASNRSVDLVLAANDAWGASQVAALKAAGYKVGARVSDQQSDWQMSLNLGLRMMTTNTVVALNKWCEEQS